MTRLLALVLSLLASPAWALCQHGLSAGTPPVRLAHIFCGEVRDDGRAVGFHSRPGGEDPAGVTETTDKRPVAATPGVYTLHRFRIAAADRSGLKTLSTMFPDHCDADQVIGAIRHAYTTGTREGAKFTGQSGATCRDANGKSFRIEGFTTTREGRLVIVTAYPN